MTVFNLTQTTKAGNEDCYHYEAADGRKVAFHADPSQAWQWIIIEGEKKTAEAVITAACVAGFRPDDMAALTIKEGR